MQLNRHMQASVFITLRAQGGLKDERRAFF